MSVYPDAERKLLLNAHKLILKRPHTFMLARATGGTEVEYLLFLRLKKRCTLDKAQIILRELKKEQAKQGGATFKVPQALFGYVRLEREGPDKGFVVFEVHDGPARKNLAKHIRKLAKLEGLTRFRKCKVVWAEAAYAEPPVDDDVIDEREQSFLTALDLLSETVSEAEILAAEQALERAATAEDEAIGWDVITAVEIARSKIVEVPEGLVAPLDTLQRALFVFTLTTFELADRLQRFANESFTVPRADFEPAEVAAFRSSLGGRAVARIETTRVRWTERLGALEQSLLTALEARDTLPATQGALGAAQEDWLDDPDILAIRAMATSLSLSPEPDLWDALQGVARALAGPTD